MATSTSAEDLKDAANSCQKLFKNMSFVEKCAYARELITIEPVICFCLIAAAMRGPTVNILLLEMACRVNERYNNSICNAVITSTHEQNNVTCQNSAVQEHINTMLAWCLPVQSIIPVILLLFLGSYSDTHRIRKPFLLLPILGEFSGTLLCITCILFKHKWSVATAGVAHYVVPAFFGGSPMLGMASFAFIADVSAPKMRTVRMAMLQICTSICNPIGMALSGALFDVIGYIPSLLVGLLVLIAALLNGVLIIKEPKILAKTCKTRGLISDIINPQYAKETLQMVTKTKGAVRVNIIFILIIDFIIVTVTAGESSVLFWFTQQTYQWKNTDYAFYQAIRSIINSVALAVGVPLFSKVFNLNDLIIIIIAFLDKIMANVICLTIKTASGLYMGMIVGMLTAIASTGLRSQTTQYVSEDNMGKTYSLLSIIEAIASSMAAQTYNQGIYSYTRESYGQAFFYVGIVLNMLGATITMWKYFRESKQPTKDDTAGKLGLEMHKIKERSL